MGPVHLPQHHFQLLFQLPLIRSSDVAECFQERVEILPNVFFRQAVKHKVLDVIQVVYLNRVRLARAKEILQENPASREPICPFLQLLCVDFGSEV